MNVSEARRKSSGALVDDVAHQAGVVEAKRHVTGSAVAPSAHDIHRSRHEDPNALSGTMYGATRDTAIEGTFNALEAAALRSSVAFAEIGVIGLFGYEVVAEGVRANEKGHEIRDAYDNDALNLAVAGNLAFDGSFQIFEDLKRPGVSKKAVAKLSIELQKPENSAVRQVLQARADEGFLAADRAMQATANVPPEQRTAAIAQWYRDNGYANRIKSDIAFGKGVEYHAFVQEPLSQQRGLSLESAREEIAKRAPLDREVWVSS